MALEAVVYPQDLFGHTCKELYTIDEEVWGCDFGLVNEEDEKMISEEWNVSYTSPEALTGVLAPPEGCEGAAEMVGRRKRRRSSKKCIKNKEEVESQRMTHIAVERNRRKQMNEYLAVLRALMPPSYVHRGDQASIVGGAINYVKELEQLLHSLEAQKRLKQQSDAAAMASPFADFFTFPQYTSCSSNGGGGSSSCSSNGVATYGDNIYSNEQKVAEKRTAIADVEVNMVESHANVKVLSKRRPKQLRKLIMGFQGLRLTPQHLNVTTVDQMVLYSFSLKVEDDCFCSSVDEIAAAVYHILGRIQEAASILVG